MKQESQLLLQSLQACRQRMDKLSYSLRKNATAFPLTTVSVQAWSEEQEESIDHLFFGIRSA